MTPGNYLKTSWKYLRRQKLYTGLNIAGLAAAMACALIIFLFVQHDWSYDRFHKDAARIFRLAVSMKMDIGEKGYSMVPSDIGLLVMDDMSGVEDVTRVSDRSSPSQVVWKGRTYQVKGLDVDPNFLKFFDFPLLSGSRATALNLPDEILLTETLAHRLFGEASPVGAVLTAPGGGSFRVTGILKDVPDNSHMQFEFLTSSPSLRNLGRSREKFDLVQTYIRLRRGTSPAAVESQFPAFLKRHTSEASAKRNRYFLQPLTSIHLASHLFGELDVNSDRRTTYYLGFLAFVILVLAGVNYMNLSASLAFGRSREVGIRKVVGAERRHILLQFFSDAILTAALAVVTAVALAYLLLPTFNSVARQKLHLDFGRNLPFYGALFVLTLAAGLFSGSIPALMASAFRPVDVLKGRVSLRPGRSGVRAVLVVFQFAVSTAFLIGTLVVVRQMHFIQTKDLGFVRNQVIVLEGVGKSSRVLKEEILRDSRIQSAALCGYTPGNDLNWPTVVVPEDKVRGPDSPKMPEINVDEDYFSTFGIPVLQGRGFSRETQASDRDAVVITEAAARVLGWPSPLGRRITLDREGRSYTIIGVVKDVYFESLRRKIGPYIFLRSADEGYYELAVRLTGRDIQGTLATIGQKWAALYPERDFAFRFLDDRIARLYEEETRVRNILSFSSLLAIMISCLGLFGLASLTAASRTKDVGIRKVLGASFPALIMTLSRDFTKYVLLANLIAWPAAYYVMDRWLQGFAYRIPLHPWLFFAGALSSAAMAGLAIGYHAVRTARTNPIESLRYE